MPKHKTTLVFGISGVESFKYAHAQIRALADGRKLAKARREGAATAALERRSRVDSIQRWIDAKRSNRPTLSERAAARLYLEQHHDGWHDPVTDDGERNRLTFNLVQQLQRRRKKKRHS